MGPTLTAMQSVKIAPSLLAADFACLGDEVARVADSVEMLHVDVMDGHFVPNLSLGLPVIESLRKVTTLPFDCHLMMSNADAYFEPLAEAGATGVTVHIEAFPEPTEVARQARDAGLGFGLVVNPPTPFEAVQPFVELCDLLVIMSVHPGFGGQHFIEAVLPKIRAARETVESMGLATDIQVDGGVTVATAPAARAAGANVFVAGTAVFRSTDPTKAVAELRDAIRGAD